MPQPPRSLQSVSAREIIGRLGQGVRKGHRDTNFQACITRDRIRDCDTPMIRLCTLAFASVLLALPISAWSFSCSMLASNLEDARSRLQRAANASDLDDGQDAARRAKSSLEDASGSAADCECLMAANELDSAATRARRARDASGADEFVEELNRAIRLYNVAIHMLRTCMRR